MHSAACCRSGLFQPPAAARPAVADAAAPLDGSQRQVAAGWHCNPCHARRRLDLAQPAVPPPLPRLLCKVLHRWHRHHSRCHCRGKVARAVGRATRRHFALQLSLEVHGCAAAAGAAGAAPICTV